MSNRGRAHGPKNLNTFCLQAHGHFVETSNRIRCLILGAGVDTLAGENAMTDAQGKAILRTWNPRTRIWPPPDGIGWWLRARPNGPHQVGPQLRAPGAGLFSTQPDGLYLFLGHAEYADVVCIEVCSSITNLNDQRSRFFPSSHSVLVDIPTLWLRQDFDLQHGGVAPAWRASGAFTAEPTSPVVRPIRHLRVLYCLPDAHYNNWKANHPPTGYEFFCRDSSLNTFNSPPTRAFLRQMSIASHFRT
jgi:hypothetical protein